MSTGFALSGELKDAFENIPDTLNRLFTGRNLGGPAGYLGILLDPDGHTVELTFGQETGLAVDSAT